MSDKSGILILAAFFVSSAVMSLVPTPPPTEPPADKMRRGKGGKNGTEI